MLTETVTTALDLRPEGPVRVITTTTVLRDGVVVATADSVRVLYPGADLAGLAADVAASVAAWWTSDRMALWADINSAMAADLEPAG